LIRLLSRITLLCSFVGIPNEAASQQTIVGNDTVLITRESAREIALERSYLVRGARYAYAAANERRTSALLEYAPSTRVGVSNSAGSSRVVTGQDNFGQPIRTDPRTFRSSSSYHSFGVSVIVLDGGQRGLLRRAAAEDSRAASADLLAAERTVSASAERLYMAALRAQRVMEGEEGLLRSAELRVQQTRRMYGMATASRADMLGAEADLLRQSSSLRRARTELAIANGMLADLLRMPARSVRVESNGIPVVSCRAAVDSAPASEVAMRDASIRAVEARVSAFEFQSKASLRRSLPTLSMSSSVTRAFSLPSYDAVWKLNPPNRGISLGVGLEVPLTGLLRSMFERRVAQNAALSQRADADRLRVERNRMVETSRLRVQDAIADLAVAQQAALLARERVDIAERSFASGASTFAALQDIVDRAAFSQRAVFEAEYAVGSSCADAEEAGLLDYLTPGRKL
jgi:outer membrane protein TolC